MTVPALDTSFIGTFAYLHPCTSLQLADVLGRLQSYQQYAEYVDGVMRVYDMGVLGGHTDVYIRIRTDGWMMAFIPDDAHQGTACWSPYAWVLDEYTCRGDLFWWGHLYVNAASPTTNSTSLAKALELLWTDTKANSDNPSYDFDWTDVGYYDYEFTSATKIYLFGDRSYTGTYWCYFTIPIGTTLYQLCASYAAYRQAGSATGHVNHGTDKVYTVFSVVSSTGEFLSVIIPSVNIYTGGVQNNSRLYLGNGTGHLGYVALTNG